MVGRLEDWLKVVSARAGVLVTPGRIEWSNSQAYPNSLKASAM